MIQPFKISGLWRIFEVVESSRGIKEDILIDEFKNAVVNAGGVIVADRVFNLGGAHFGSCFIGVGDSAAATTIGMTDLQAATNKLRKATDAAPVRTGQTVAVEATFGTSEANWQWNEIALFNAISGVTMFSRGNPSSPVTKTPGLILKARYEVTFPMPY